MLLWSPPAGYELALEVIPIADLRRRAAPESFRSPTRLGFFLLFAVTRGRTRHGVDFTSVSLEAGSWLLLRPGQMQRFDLDADWDGLLIAFRPELLPPIDAAALALSSRLEDLSGRFDLSPPEHAACLATARQMRRDASMAASIDDRNALMLHQISTLLVRLRMVRSRVGVEGENARQSARVTKFRRLLDGQFLEHREVAWYARALSCSPKTLSRAALAVTGRSAKALISDRVALEAKRLLIHTRQPIQAIAEALGFDEPTNFVKFFRREVGPTPTAFRALGGPASADV
jgi:AraC-like DNA-binding protein